MKVAVVYNRESKNVINLFGSPNQEIIGLKTIKRITDALKSGGHQVKAIEGDKDLVDKLEEFMPSVLKNERPGMVFNISYGIQGQARYTHVPSILEMVGVPYVASGPLAHSLALDKVVSKMIFKQRGIPTAEFFVLDGPETPIPPDAVYPLIVKPKNEAVSFGIKVCNDEQELRLAAQAIFDHFDNQPVLAEQYIDGREVNVGVLGNDPPEALPPVELRFGEGGPNIYTYEDKTRTSGRTIEPVCPAPIGDGLTQQVKDSAIKAFNALGCFDCARVDMRIDADDNIYVLEVNSLPSMGEHGSYVEGAAHAGLDFAALANRLVEVASARYFGTPAPASISLGDTNPEDQVFRFVTERRDRLERRLKDLTAISSRTDDRIGHREMVKHLSHRFQDLGLKLNEQLSDENVAWTFSSARGLDDGLLFLVQIDVPHDPEAAPMASRRDPQWIYGEGVGASRAPLVVVEYALRAARYLKKLRNMPVGVLIYGDEGRDCVYSARTIRSAASKAREVFVMRPGGSRGELYAARRGLRKYRFDVEGKPQRLGQAAKKPDVMRWTWQRLESIANLSSRKERVAVSAVDIQTRRVPMKLPHRVSATLWMTYGSTKVAGQTEERMRILLGKEDYKWDLALLSDRPPLTDRTVSKDLVKRVGAVGEKWDITVKTDSSVWPSAAGLVPDDVAAVCGLGPIAQDVYSSREAVQRTSVLRRTLLLAEYLIRHGERPKG